MRSWRTSANIEAGVVVSRSSPGIALFNCRCTQRAERHTAIFKVSFRDWRIFQDIFRIIRHEASQFYFFLIDTFQDGSGSEKFERAAQRETFLRPVINTFPAASVQSGDPDSAAQS